MKKFTLKFFSFSLLGIMLIMQSCSNEDSLLDSSSLSTASDETLSTFGLPNKSGKIRTLNYNDLIEIKNKLTAAKINLPDLELKEPSKSDKSKPFVQVLKVSTKTAHPDRSGKTIDVSGVLLLPTNLIPSSSLKNRIIIAPPPTYTYNKLAPSNAFKGFKWTDDDLHFNYLAFWTIQAYNGFIVFFPDYPGFGDSYKQCQHPFLDSKAMVNSTLDLFKSAKVTLTKNGYKFKKDLIITGYSLGGFIAASLAREIETNPSHGLSVDLLVTGGTPCNLKQIIDSIRASKKTEHNYFIAYGLWGYQKNAYPYINITDFLKEPYASKSLSWFDGTHYDSDVNSYFSNRPKDIYTEKFMKSLDTDATISYVNDILVENSVKPWKNKCKFIMTHGVSDLSVNYQNASDFSKQQNQIGGKVTFIPTVGEHEEGVIPYYLNASYFTAIYK